VATKKDPGPKRELCWSTDNQGTLERARTEKEQGKFGGKGCGRPTENDRFEPRGETLVSRHRPGPSGKAEKKLERKKQPEDKPLRGVQSHSGTGPVAEELLILKE